MRGLQDGGVARLVEGDAEGVPRTGGAADEPQQRVLQACDKCDADDTTAVCVWLLVATTVGLASEEWRVVTSRWHRSRANFVSDHVWEWWCGMWRALQAPAQPAPQLRAAAVLACGCIEDKTTGRAMRIRRTSHE